MIKEKERERVSSKEMHEKLVKVLKDAAKESPQIFTENQEFIEQDALDIIPEIYAFMLEVTKRTKGLGIYIGLSVPQKGNDSRHCVTVFGAASHSTALEIANRLISHLPVELQIQNFLTTTKKEEGNV